MENDYYVEVPTAAAAGSASRRVRFSDLKGGACGPPEGVRRGAVILDFAAADVDAEYERIGPWASSGS